MQTGQNLTFNCVHCQNSIPFSIFELRQNKTPLACSKCNQIYQINDPDLLRQLTKFENLCTQLIDSEEILSDTSIGITVGEKDVDVPFKLLLTRFTSRLKLQIGPHALQIEFRIEPAKDLIPA